MTCADLDKASLEAAKMNGQLSFLDTAHSEAASRVMMPAVGGGRVGRQRGDILG